MDITIFQIFGVATIVAAFIGALASLVSLVNSKEQKTTEFRQAWINSLRAEVAKFAAQARFISAAIQHAKRIDPLYFSRDSKVYEQYAENRSEIANAYYLISLHFKPADMGFEELKKSMDEVVLALGRPHTVTFKQIIEALDRMTHQVRALLKSEWERVKSGEPTYKWTKRVTIVLGAFFFLTILVAGYGVRQGWFRLEKPTPQLGSPPGVTTAPPENKGQPPRPADERSRGSRQRG